VFAPDPGRLLSFGRDKRALVWDVAAGRVEKTIPVEHDQGITAAQYSGDGRLLVTASRDNSAWIVDAVRGVPLFRLWHKFPVTSVDFSPNGRILATASDKLYLWHTGSGTELAVLDAPKRYESAARFSPDGKTLLVWGGGAAHVFDVALLTSNDAASLRRSVCGKSGGITTFTPEDMRDPILGGGIRMPCAR
jgi:WD40 repeat protein